MSGGARLSDNEGQFWDVVICGGGLAGLLLAMQLRQEAPELSVAVLERTERPLPDAAHKVGESSVELGSQYLERLGLEPYLLERHLIKFALRFFPGGGDRPPGRGPGWPTALRADHAGRRPSRAPEALRRAAAAHLLRAAELGASRPSLRPSNDPDWPPIDSISDPARTCRC